MCPWSNTAALNVLKLRPGNELIWFRCVDSGWGLLFEWTVDSFLSVARPSLGQAFTHLIPEHVGIQMSSWSTQWLQNGPSWLWGLCANLCALLPPAVSWFAAKSKRPQAYLSRPPDQYFLCSQVSYSVKLLIWCAVLHFNVCKRVD